MTGGGTQPEGVAQVSYRGYSGGGYSTDQEPTSSGIYMIRRGAPSKTGSVSADQSSLLQ